MKYWRLILWLLACLLIWVFAHDYVSSHVNQRIDAQLKLEQQGELDFKWNPADSNDVVTDFDSEASNSGYHGKHVALSMTMPAWPLDANLYDQFQLRFKVSKAVKVTVVLETSGPNHSETNTTISNSNHQGTEGAVSFFTAKKAVHAGIDMNTHEIELDELEWATLDGRSLSWQDINEAKTWVVRLFAKEPLDWQIESIALPQTKLPKAAEWQVAECLDLPVTGWVKVSCFWSNRMIQIDHKFNQSSNQLAVKFNAWLPFEAWQQLALTIVVLMLATVSYVRFQFALLLVFTVLTVMLYVPLGDLFGRRLSENVWMNGLLVLPAIWFVFIKNKSWWLVSQKGSIKLWLIVLSVAGLLMLLADFSLKFLPLLPVYFLWAGFQQTLMVSLFQWLNKSKAFNKKGTDWPLLVFVAACFAVLHMPNHYLMVLTFASGLFWVYIWSKYKNLLLMVVSHSLWALLLYQVAGEAWLYSARVGLGFL